MTLPDGAETTRTDGREPIPTVTNTDGKHNNDDSDDEGDGDGGAASP